LARFDGRDVSVIVALLADYDDVFRCDEKVSV
jgi:hypothetical protein